MRDGKQFGVAHIEARAQVAEARSNDAINGFFSAAMNMEPIDPMDALVAAYALQAVGKVKGARGVMGIEIEKSRGKKFTIESLKPDERSVVMGICLLYKDKQIKRSIALDELSAIFNDKGDRDTKTLERILKDGVKQWGGLLEFIEAQSGEPANFLQRLKAIKGKSK